MEVGPPPTKAWAASRGVPVLQPQTVKDPGFLEEVRSLGAEVGVIVAFGEILPQDLLSSCPRGFLNLHFSLLPAYRGAAPVARALMDGVTVTGVTVFQVDPGVDTGPIILQEKVEVGPEETCGELTFRLATLGAGMLVRALDLVERGEARPVPQDPSLASRAPKLRPEEALLDWSRPGRELANLVRALNPEPGAYTFASGRRLKVWRARVRPGRGEPGLPVGVEGEELLVGTGEGLLGLLEVQPEGRGRMSGAAFFRGWRRLPEERLG